MVSYGLFLLTIIGDHLQFGIICGAVIHRISEFLLHAKIQQYDTLLM